MADIAGNIVTPLTTDVAGLKKKAQAKTVTAMGPQPQAAGGFVTNPITSPTVNTSMLSSLGFSNPLANFANINAPAFAPYVVNTSQAATLGQPGQSGHPGQQSQLPASSIFARLPFGAEHVGATSTITPQGTVSPGLSSAATQSRAGLLNLLPQIEQRTGGIGGFGVPQITLPEFQQFDPGALPRTSVSETLGQSISDLQGAVPTPTVMPTQEAQRAQFISAGEITDPGFMSAGQATAPEFVRTKPMTESVLQQSPEFKQVQRDISQSLDRASDQLADEMSRRGILDSGSTQEAFGRLAESAQDALAQAGASIAGPLIQESLVNQYINDPIRETAFLQQTGQFSDQFRQQEANRNQQYLNFFATAGPEFAQREAERQQQVETRFADLQNAFNQQNLLQQQNAADTQRQTLIDLGMNQVDLERAFAEDASGVLQNNFNQLQQYRALAANLPVTQREQEEQRINNYIGMLRNVLDGTLPIMQLEQATLSNDMQRAQLGFQQQQAMFNQNMQEEMQDIQRQANDAREQEAAMSGLGSALGTVIGAIVTA